MLSDIAELKAKLTATNDETDNLHKFIRIVRKYTEFNELTPELLHSFVDRIYIGEQTEEYGRAIQEVKIVYKFVGVIQ